MRIAPEPPIAPDLLRLLEEHVAEMRRTSPPESVHALDALALAAPEVLLLVARSEHGALLGVGAVKDLGDGTGEIKSMRTAAQARGAGVAAAVLAGLVEHAHSRDWTRVNLETGSQPFFDPAVRLYLRHGFVPCGPFAAYTDDPHSRFLTLAL